MRSYGEVMEVRLFGELEAVAAGVPVPVRGAKQRVLLALLALQRGQPVSAGRLVLQGTADMHVGMSEVYRERDDLPAATQHLLTSQELGEHLGLPQNR
ncbi:MAG: hypothetical protein WBF34_26880, partial [Streptosporangiaceae bacterium]